MTDRTVGETFYLMFTTRAFATGVPTVLAGTPVVSAYEDNSAIQITAGITLGVDHDSVAGLNLLTIVATGANGYEAGKDYNLVITTGTVSSVSVVGEVVGTFSLGLSAAFTRLGAPAGASVSADVAAIEGQTDDIGVAGAGLTAVPWNAAWDAEVQSECADAITAAALATAANLATVDTVVDGIQADLDNATDGLGAIKADTAATLVDTSSLNDTKIPDTISLAAINAECDTAITDAALATAANLTAVDTVVDAIKAVTDVLPNSGALTDLATATSITALNDVSTADINAQVLDVLNTDTFAELSSIPAAATTLTNMIRMVYLLSTNKVTETATTQTLRNRADGATIGTSTVSDDATTGTRGSFS